MSRSSDLPQLDAHLEAEYTGHTGSVFALAVNPTEQFAYTSGDDGIVARWDLSKTEPDAVAVLRVPTSIYALYFITELGWLAAGASDGSLYLIDLETGQMVSQHAFSNDAIYGFAAHPTAPNRLLSLHGGGFMAELSLPDGEQQSWRRIAGQNLREAIRWEDRLFVATSDSRIIVLAGPSLSLIHDWQGHTPSVFCLGITEKPLRLLSGGRDAYLRSWDLSSPHKLQLELPAHNYTLNGISVSPDGKWVATVSRDKTLKIWNAADLQLLKVVDAARHNGHTHSVNRVHWLQDGSIITVGDDRRVLRWRFEVAS